jgi:hypothetical protein
MEQRRQPLEEEMTATIPTTTKGEEEGIGTIDVLVEQEGEEETRRKEQIVALPRYTALQNPDSTPNSEWISFPLGTGTRMIWEDG